MFLWVLPLFGDGKPFPIVQTSFDDAFAAVSLGRIYSFRQGLSADWARVFAVAAELDKAVEIDSYPDRQDLSIDLIKLAGKTGCRISIGTDSHGPAQLEFIAFGLAAALKGRIDRDRILNFMSRDELVGWAAKLRESQQ